MKIGTKLSLALCGAVALGCVTSGFVAAFVARNVILSIIGYENLKHSEMLGKAAEAAFRAGAPEVLRGYLSALREAPGVLYSYVRSGDGRILLHTDPSAQGLPAERWKQAADVAGALEYTSPVVINGRLVAEARFGVQSGLSENISNLVQSAMWPPLALFGTIGLGLMLGLGFLLAMWLVRPITALEEGSRKVGEGDLAVSVPVVSSDEIGILTERFNAMVADLKNLDEIKSEFIATVSHDLRGPLGAIRLYLDYMLNEDPERDKLSQKHQKMLKTILDNSMRLSVFVGNILDSAKMKAGKMQYEMQAVDPAPIARNLVELYAVVCRHKGLRMDAEFPEEPLWVDADPERLDQVLSNLVSNALKFTPQGGSISIGAQPAGERVRISVSDTGKGIAPEALKGIFDRFSQADIASQKEANIQGTGLGLSIVKQTVEAMGGRVEVQSELGRGTRVTLELARAGGKKSA